MNTHMRLVIALSVVGALGIAMSGQLIYDTLMPHGLDDPLHLIVGGVVSACIAFLIIIHALSTLSLMSKIKSDQLTGLDSRAHFITQLGKTIKNAKPLSDTFHIVLLDLNKFKQVNDTLSHAHGDELLKIIATRIKDTAKGCISVARVGGDEFALLLPDHSENRLEYKKVIDTLISTINSPIKLED